jgi:hypothetical protein
VAGCRVLLGWILLLRRERGRCLYVRGTGGRLPPVNHLLPAQRWSDDGVRKQLRLGRRLLRRPTSALLLAVLCAAISCCGSRTHRIADAGLPRGRDAETDLDAGEREDAAPRSDGGELADAGTDAAAEPRRCRVADDCLEWWPAWRVLCDMGQCCAGRLDRFGCVCGRQRGGCDEGEWCCDDPLDPDHAGGCSNSPCVK